MDEVLPVNHLSLPISPAEIDWIFLDAYGTIFEEDLRLIHEVCRAIESASGSRASADEIGRWWEASFQGLTSDSNGERFITHRAVVERSLHETCRHFRAEIPEDEWLQALYRYWRTATPFPDTRAFLETCPVPICVVSNIDQDDLHRASERAAVEFAETVTSEGARSYKPDSGIFDFALRATKARPERVVHVGDSFVADVVGAHEAGIRAIWLNRSGELPPSGARVRPDAVIAGLLDLVDLGEIHHGST